MQRRWMILMMATVVSILVAACGTAGGDQPASDADEPSDPPATTQPVGVVSGTVTDAAGEPVAEVSILRESLTGAEVTDIAMVTGPEGTFEWTMPPGEYEVMVYLDGDQLASEQVEVVADQTVTVDFVIP